MSASTRYFLFLKSATESIAADQKSRIIAPTEADVAHILPSVNISYYGAHGLFEKTLIEWCQEFGSPEKLFLDIGAHSGTYAISLAPKFAAVHAFEPQRATFYSLCGGVALSGLSERIMCHNFGLGATEQVGTRTLNIVSPDGGGSSLHEIPGRQILRQEAIEIRTLDSLEIQEQIGFIKMDVEDNELYVLKGGVETLKRSGFPPILFESNHENEALFSFLRGLGYAINPIRGYPNMFLASKSP